MELTVYRQSSKVRPDGTVVYKGEDALPYVDNNILMVADGLGGAASIRHQKIKSELFNEDTLLDTLFEGVYDDYYDSDFADYVKRSFSELRSVKDCYTDNINNIKKSGYFASRIVTAIILHEFKYNRTFVPEFFFSAIEGEPEVEIELGMKKLGDYFAEKIKILLSKIAENANIIYESAYTGLALLGTTLCASLFIENKDSVDVMFITAGDSRPYIWTEDDGLCQIIADEERADGGMTNYISANNDFDIECTYRQFKKPCVIFGASDGCFDSGAFLSPMAFERLILESTMKSNNTEELSEFLTSFFIDYGRHDDSSTIAMKFFGFEDFEAFKKSAEKRLEELNELYFSKLPELLEKDFTAELQNPSAEENEKYSYIKTTFANQPDTMEYCISKVRDEVAEKVKSEGNEELANARKLAEEKRAEAVSFIERNYSGFAVSIPELSDDERKTAKKIQSTGEDCVTQYETYMRQAEGQRSEIEDLYSRLTSIMDSIINAGVPEKNNDFAELDISGLKKCENSMSRLTGFMTGLKSGNNTAVNSITEKRNEYFKSNEKLSRSNAEKFNAVCESIISGEISSENVLNVEPSAETISELFREVNEKEAAVRKLEEQLMRKMLNSSASAYWGNNYLAVTEASIKGEYGDIPEKLAEKIASVVKSMENDELTAEEKAELQNKLFEEYEAVYSTYMVR